MAGIEVTKRNHETTQTLIRRFIKAVRDSGALYAAKTRRFRKRPKSETAKKTAALRREEVKQERLLQEKLGR